MLRFLHRRFLQLSILSNDSNATNPFLNFLLQTKKPASLKSFSNLSVSTKQPSVTVSYLIDSCGLSPESALSASKQISRKTTTTNADSVLALFKNHGFSNTHISQLISKCPKLLSAKPYKTLKPKLDFFNDFGFSGPALPRLLISDSQLLTISLKNQIIPTIDFLKSLVRTNENVLLILRRSTRIIQYKPIISTNISMLKNNGVPESNISKLFLHQPRTLKFHPDRLCNTVAITKEMGFNPLSWNFVVAVRVMSCLSKSKWEHKMEVYKSLGWSQDELLSAFRVQPNCMVSSTEKIRRLMNFFVNELGLKPSVLSKWPNLLLLSLDKRIVPRCSVLQILLSKGLVKSDLNICSVLNQNKTHFLKHYVIKFQENVPDVLKAYRGEIGFERVSWV